MRAGGNQSVPIPEEGREQAWMEQLYQGAVETIKMPTLSYLRATLSISCY